jgi:hypothetical protein
MGMRSICQHAIGVCQALTGHELRKTGAVDLEQLLEVKQGHAVTGRDRRFSSIWAVIWAVMSALMAASRAARTPRFSRKLRPIGCRSEGHGSEIIDVGDGDSLQFECANAFSSAITSRYLLSGFSAAVPRGSTLTAE